jgi:WbqC-like protein family
MTEVGFPIYIFPTQHWFREVIRCNSNSVELEMYSNWQKQSPLTRYRVAGPNKILQLVVPTKKKSRKLIKDIEIDYSENWIINHWRSLQAAYNRSPFFEFYQDELQKILETRYEKLFELNMATIKWCSEKLQISTDYSFSNKFKGNRQISTKVETEYPQVFSAKHGYISNLSVLDLLFNLGSGASTIIR